MSDPRIEKAAKLLIEHSVMVKKGENIMIDASAEAAPLVLELYKQIIQKGAFPVSRIGLYGMSYNYFKYASDEQIKNFPQLSLDEMKKMDGWIGISSASNLRELSNIDPKKLSMRGKVTRPISDERLKKKWVLFAYPTAAFAQEAEMALTEFEDFVYGACLQDWKKIGTTMEKLKKVLEKAKEIRVVAKDTDLRYSTKGRKWIIDDGTHNMPGGEIFSAPVEGTVDGHIKFDIPAVSAGKELVGVYFEFKKGKMVKATAEKNQDYLHALLDTDEGAKIFGESGIGTNYNIKNSVKQILFDEKIGGTVHFAIGSAYEECNGKNKSAVHLDFIRDLRKGGKMYADGKLIQENGKFLI